MDPLLRYSCFGGEKREIYFGEEGDGEKVDDNHHDSEEDEIDDHHQPGMRNNTVGVTWWNSAPKPTKKKDETWLEKQKTPPKHTQHHAPLRNDGEEAKIEKKTKASKKNHLQQQGSTNTETALAPLCVLNVIVNGTLLSVSSGGGVRIAAPPATSDGAQQPQQQLHVVCLSESGCIVHVGGVGVCALGFGEAVSFISPSCGGGLWVAFCANSGAKKHPGEGSGNSSEDEEEEEVASICSSSTSSNSIEEEKALDDEKKDTLKKGGCANDPLFFGAVQRVWLSDIGRAAAQGGGRWRSYATSFSTMVRFLQRYTTELRWQRPADGEPTIVEWGVEEEREEEEAEEEEQGAQGGGGW